MSKAKIVKNIFLQFNNKTAQRYLDYFWKNGKVGAGGKMQIPKESAYNISQISRKTGFPPKVLQNMAQDRLKLGTLKDLRALGSPKKGSYLDKIINKDWTGGLQPGFIRTKRTGATGRVNAPRNLGKYELDELRNSYMQPNKAFPKLTDDADFFRATNKDLN